MKIKTVFHSIILVALILLASPSFLWADELDVRFEIGASGAILGDNSNAYGVEGGYRVSPDLRARLSHAALSYQSAKTLAAIQVDQRVDQNNVRLVLDWFPWTGLGLYGSLGVTHLGDPGKFTITPTDGRGYTINGVLYSSKQIGMVTGTMKTHTLVPYLGIGSLYHIKPTERKGWYFQMELGMVSNLEPRLKIQSVNAEAPPQLLVDLQAQADKESEKLPDAYTLYGVSFGYRF